MRSLLRKKKGTFSWWEEEFTAEERRIIDTLFDSPGQITGMALANSSNPKDIATLASYLRNPEHKHLAYRLLDRADSLDADGLAILDRHFHYASAGAFYYRWRDVDDFALPRSIYYFQKQISIAPVVAEFFRTDRNWGFIPAHAGYRQMRIIYEKQKEYEKAFSLCQKAMNEGWADDWEKHIKRIRGKLEVH